MKRKSRNAIVYLLTIVALSLMGCSGDPLTAQDFESENQNVVNNQRGTAIDDLQLVPVKPEIASRLRALNKSGYSEKQIQSHNGGTVGGEKTYGNKVNFPPDALPSDTWVSVEVECIESNNQCGTVIEFLPSMKFNSDVTVTLSFDVLDFNGDPDLLKVVWYDEASGLWVEVDNPIIDYDDKTVSVLVDHFTRYSWSL